MHVPTIVPVIGLGLAIAIAGSTTRATDPPKPGSSQSTDDSARWISFQQTPHAVVPGGRRLREISSPDRSFPLLVGAASNARFWNTATAAILDREFAYVTPGNDFKQTAIHPQPGVWRWTKADQWINRCRTNGQVMRLHAAISPQCSRWAKDDRRTPRELEQNLREYVEAVCKRYNGQPHVRWIDVVNETVSRNGEWFGPREGNDRWENPWYQIGPDPSHPLKPPRYIKLAFQIANRHAPNMKLILNQHGGMEPAMWDKVKATIVYLQQQGLRVDGLGWQAHINTGFEKDTEQVARLRSLIEWAHSRKLEFHVTEFNAWIRKPKGESITGRDLEAQAATYRFMIELLAEHAKTGTVTWCTWQVQDNQTERGHLRGNLFDEHGRPKPAYYAVQQALEQLDKQHAP